MKNNKFHIKKVPAFTMMDLLTGMVIMSIIVAIVFYMMTSTNQQVHSFGKIRAEIVSFNLMKSDLYHNAELAEKIIEIPNGFVMIADEKEVRYELNNETLIRTEALNSDTLSAAVSDVLTIGKTDDEQALVSEIMLTCHIKKKEFKLYIYKSYDDKEIINNELLSEFTN